MIGEVDNFARIERFMSFDSDDQFYFVQILQRKKDGPASNGAIVSGTNNKSRAIKSYCVTSREYLEQHEFEIRELCRLFNARAYFSPARRSFEKIALANLVNLSKHIADGNYSHAKTDYWGACGQTGIEKFYLVDIDEEHDNYEDLTKIESFLQIDVRSEADRLNRIVLNVPTVHGRHFICKPFDINAFKQLWPDIDVHRNSPTLLYKAATEE